MELKTTNNRKITFQSPSEFQDSDEFNQDSQIIAVATNVGLCRVITAGSKDGENQSVTNDCCSTQFCQQLIEKIDCLLSCRIESLLQSKGHLGRKAFKGEPTNHKMLRFLTSSKKYFQTALCLFAGECCDRVKRILRQ